MFKDMRKMSRNQDDEMNLLARISSCHSNGHVEDSAYSARVIGMLYRTALPSKNAVSANVKHNKYFH